MKKRSDRHPITTKLIFILLILLFIPLVSSAPPVTTTQQFQFGYIIVDSPQEYLTQKQDFRINFFVYNISNNKHLTNTSVNCSYYLANSSGELIFFGSVPWLIEDYWSLKLNGGNFSYSGIYSYGINCFNSAFEGQTTGVYYVTPNGEELTSSSSIIYFLVTLFAFGIFFLLCWIFLNINGENPKDETGFLGINYRKYLKASLFPLVYVSFLWAFNFIIGLSNNYLGLTLYSNTLEFMFMILTKLVYPVIVVTIIICIVLLIKDSNIEKEYKSLWSRY